MTTAPTPEPAPATPSTPAPEAPKAPEPSALSLLYPEDEKPAAPETPAAEEPKKDESTPEGDKKPEGEAEGETIATAAELIEHYQLDPEFFNSLKVDVKVDRQTTQVPIAELVKSYQIGAAAEKRLEDAKAKAQALTTDLATKTETLQNQLAAAAALVKEAEAELAREYKAIDWKSLKEKDPAKYAADQLDFKARQERIEELKEKGKGAWRSAVEPQQAEALEALKERLAEENEKLLSAIPEWKDEKTRKAEKAQVVDYLTGTVGLTRDQVATVSDHRMIVLARKAMQFDALQTKTDVAKQKVAKIPKVLKPGGTTPVAPKNTTIVQDLYGT